MFDHRSLDTRGVRPLQASGTRIVRDDERNRCIEASSGDGVDNGLKI
jgi:hypothetical protein